MIQSLKPPLAAIGEGHIRSIIKSAIMRNVTEVPAAYPRIACETPVDCRGLGESCNAASVRYSGFSIGERGSNFPIGLPCGVLLLIYLQHVGMLYIDSSTYGLVIYGLLICSSSCYYKMHHSVLLAQRYAEGTAHL
jgi:hypothetical protein